MVYTGKIIIVIEGLENFIDPETGGESSLKFWLPKTLPDRVRLIVACSPTSKSSEYMKGLGCSVISIKSDRKIIRSVVDNIQSNIKNLLVTEDHMQRLEELLEKKIADDNDKKIKMLFVKGIVGLLAPKVYPAIQNLNYEKEFFRKIQMKINWKRLEGSHD